MAVPPRQLRTAAFKRTFLGGIAREGEAAAEHLEETIVGDEGVTEIAHDVFVRCACGAAIRQPAGFCSEGHVLCDRCAIDQCQDCGRQAYRVHRNQHESFILCPACGRRHSLVFAVSLVAVFAAVLAAAGYLLTRLP